MYRDRKMGQYLLTIEDLNTLCYSYGIDPSSVYIRIKLYYEGYEYRFLDIQTGEEVLKYYSYTGNVLKNKCEISIASILGVTGQTGGT